MGTKFSIQAHEQISTLLRAVSLLQSDTHFIRRLLASVGSTSNDHPPRTYAWFIRKAIADCAGLWSLFDPEQQSGKLLAGFVSGLHIPDTNLSGMRAGVQDIHDDQDLRRASGEIDWTRGALVVSLGSSWVCLVLPGARGGTRG